jgi:hypothetical protein
MNEEAQTWSAVIEDILDPVGATVIRIDQARINVASLVQDLNERTVYSRTLTLFPRDDDEIALRLLDRAFNFPLYFGFNWAAADECLRDLSWLGQGLAGYCAVIVPWIADGGHPPREVITTLVKTFEFCGTYWRVRGMPFKLVVPTVENGVTASV